MIKKIKEDTSTAQIAVPEGGLKKPIKRFHEGEYDYSREEVKYQDNKDYEEFMLHGAETKELIKSIAGQLDKPQEQDPTEESKELYQEFLKLLKHYEIQTPNDLSKLDTTSYITLNNLYKDVLNFKTLHKLNESKMKTNKVKFLEAKFKQLTGKKVMYENYQEEISDLNSEETKDTEAGVDTITVDVPLLIRLMEFAKEDAEDDVDLHVVAENLASLSEGGNPLTMEDYETAIDGAKSNEEESEDSEDEGADLEEAKGDKPKKGVNPFAKKDDKEDKKDDKEEEEDEEKDEKKSKGPKKGVNPFAKKEKKDDKDEKDSEDDKDDDKEDFYFTGKGSEVNVKGIDKKVAKGIAAKLLAPINGLVSPEGKYTITFEFKEEDTEE